MVQESKSKVLIVGAGPAGCMSAYFLQNDFEVEVFDKNSPLLTLLPTGGGRCNLAHNEFDFKELAKNYPRGEKFLYSVFSRFSTSDTIDFFKQMGVETYIQDDGRIFPKSNSATDLRNTFLNKLENVKFKKEEVLRINKKDKGYEAVTNKSSYYADFVIISIGGHSSFELVRLLGHNIIDLKPSLTALKTKEDFSQLAGVSINGVLFTHKGVSGPEIYRLSSLHARDNFPYKLSFNFFNIENFQEILNSNPHKLIRNLLAEYLPKSFVKYVLKDLQISETIECCKINGKIRDKITDRLADFEITVESTVTDGEVVMSGGVDLKEVDSKTLESKLLKHIYFCGEVLDIDGFCGGFNLQNCWSDGFIAADSILHANSIKYIEA